MPTEHSENSVFRVLDAAINRAAEGLRVVEDDVRMRLSDAHLSSQLKQLRHDLTVAVEGIDPAKRIVARDSVGDVGRTICTDSEYDRGSDDGDDFSNGIVQANLARAQQALRTIEEFSKLGSFSKVVRGAGQIARQVEQLRYRVYTIEKAIMMTVVSQRNLANSNLFVLIDACRTETDQQTRDASPVADVSSHLTETVIRLIESEVDLIQLRDKTLTDRQLVNVGRAISALTRGTRTRFIMNDRADLAVAAMADGVHLGQDDLTVAAARPIVGAARMIGVSTHTIEQARQAVLDGANYIGVGPVFFSATKQFKSTVGLELVQKVATEIQLPAFAIGGIELSNLGLVLEAGLTRVAVKGAVGRSEDIQQTIFEFKKTLRGAS